MSELGVGIIGCGVISEIYMTNLASVTGAKLVGCADILPEASRKRSEQFGIENLTVAQLLARPDIGLVVNLTPPVEHFGVSMAALKAGKHVFSEKPFGVAANEGRQLLAEADKRGLRMGCAPDTFLGAGGRLAREIIDGGKIGKVLSGSCFMLQHGMEHWHPDPEFFFKPGGGPVLDVGPYYLVALINLLGPVESVTARASTGFAERIVTAKGPRTGDAIKVETPTNVMALLHFASGADITFMMSWDVWKHGHPPIELYGTEGSLKVPDPNFFGGTVQYTERGGDWIAVSAATKPFGKPNYKSIAWPAERAPEANYRCLGLSEMVSAINTGTVHRAAGTFANHVLEVMDQIVAVGIKGGTAKITTKIDRPAALSDEDAKKLWKSPTW
jgi:predicted dehydrogenase